MSKRWNFDNEFLNIYKSVVKTLKNGGRLGPDVSNIGSDVNTLDLRGASFELLTIKNCLINNVDFSYSSFRNCWLENLKFENCYFYKVDLSQISDHNNTFINCNFVECNFNGAGIGYKGSKIISSKFEKCNFTRTIFNRPEFVDVKFEKCKLKNIDFSASSFESCSFEGLLNNVWFRGGFPLQSLINTFGQPKKNEMKFVSFENAELIDLTFSDNCDLSSVSVGNSDIYIKFDHWKNRLDQLKVNLKDWEELERKEAEIFFDVYSVHAVKQDWYILSRYDIDKQYGKEISEKIINTMMYYNNKPYSK